MQSRNSYIYHAIYVVNYSTYICKYYRVYIYYTILSRQKAAAADEWPGNNIPTFRNNQANTSKLDALVKKIAPSCKLPYFDEGDIRLHIMDSLSERRSNVRNGYDYENVSCQL